MEIELADTHCTCNNTSYKEIIHLVNKQRDVKTIEDLQNYCRCADRCNRCTTDIQEIIDFFRKDNTIQ